MKFSTDLWEMHCSIQVAGPGLAWPGQWWVFSLLNMYWKQGVCYSTACCVVCLSLYCVWFILSALFSSGLAPVLVVVLAPGAVLDLVPAIHAQGHAVGPIRVPVAVPGHAQTARALVGSLVPAANPHVKARASHDQSQSEQVIITAILVEVFSWDDAQVCAFVLWLCVTKLSYWTVPSSVQNT